MRIVFKLRHEKRTQQPNVKGYIFLSSKFVHQEKIITKMIVFQKIFFLGQCAKIGTFDIKRFPYPLKRIYMSSGQNKNRKTEIIETGMFRAAEIEIIKNENKDNPQYNSPSIWKHLRSKTPFGA